MVNRNFIASEPNQLWLVDTIYVPTMAGFLYLAVVLDAAVSQRRQDTSVASGRHCGEASVRPSMGSMGDAYDNAMAESFFSTLEAKLLNRRRFAS